MRSVLLVEDADATREAFTALLECEGYRALAADNGLTACDLAREHVPDLIVMDLNMPVLSGWDAALALKADPRTAHIPLIALSAWPATEEDCARTLACGFSSVITKPLPPGELLAEIRRQLGDEPAAAGEPRWLNTRSADPPLRRSGHLSSPRRVREPISGD